MDFKICAFVVLACASLACADGDNKSSTTVAPTRTPAPETTTTPQPVTTSSTAAPTTSSAAPPTTSTAQPVTPTPTPAPVPSDGRGNWTVNDGNVTCVIAQMALSAKIAYPIKNSNKTEEATLSIPASAKASGTCGSDSQNLDLTWNDDSLKIAFGKNTTTKSYFVSNVSLTLLINDKIFPNVSDSWVNSSKTFESKLLEFATALNQSYRCSRDEMVPLKSVGSEKNDAVLTISKVQLQAFHDKDSAVFGEVHDCETDTPDIVPIAVGCALAGLVIVVLVAYLVGRRRSLARGYLSM